MNYELIIWITGLMLLAYWLNYVMGSPLADDPTKVDVRAILFRIPLNLARRRIRGRHKYYEILRQFDEELKLTTDELVRHELKRDRKGEIYRVGREFFTWERSLLCPICFHWWITLIFGVICLSFNLLHARQDLLLAGFTYLLNHFFIRKIS